MDPKKTGQKATEAVRAKTGNKQAPTVETWAIATRKNVEDDIYKMAAPVSQVLPAHLKWERFSQIAISNIMQDANLRQCDKKTVMGALMQAAYLQLSPVPHFGHCYFIPRFNKRLGYSECTFLIGYKGYIDLLYKTGRVNKVYAYLVYKGDKFKYELGLHPNITHEPTEAENRGAVTYAYAVAHLKEGGEMFEVMSEQEIIATAKHSSNYGTEYSPWMRFPDQMRRKTVIHRLQNYMPMTADYLSQVATDETVIEHTMFDHRTGELDLTQVRHVEAEEVTDPVIDTMPNYEDESQIPEADQAPPPAEKPVPNGVKPDNQLVVKRFKEVNGVIKEILKTDPNYDFMSVIGVMGYTNLDEPTDAQWEKIKSEYANKLSNLKGEHK